MNLDHFIQPETTRFYDDSKEEIYSFEDFTEGSETKDLELKGISSLPVKKEI
jgi:hypothetical protein